VAVKGFVKGAANRQQAPRRSVVVLAWQGVDARARMGFTMEEQIYLMVWCQAFAATCVRLHGADDDAAIEHAAIEADWAAANAVEHWDEGKRQHAIAAKNEASK